MPVSDEVLKKYPNSIFIETGTDRGAGIVAALKAGFKKVYSIEVNQHKFKDASLLFKENPAVTILYGDSKIKLKEVLEKISEPVTLWLDAHRPFILEELQSNDGCPILQELEIIKQHPVKSHTILIDDRRLFVKPQGFWGISYNTVVQYLMKINESYKILLEDGYVKDDIIVAVEENRRFSE